MSISVSIKAYFGIATTSPSITVVNNNPSAGASDTLWWFQIMTPSGLYLHNGSMGTPDITGFWTSWTMPEAWISPFPPPTIEFSSNVPYIITCYAYDGSTSYSGYTQQLIVAPPGNTASLYNLGQASVSMQVRCNSANIYAQDTTVYSYQGILSIQDVNSWTITYPPDSTGVVPAPYSAGGGGVPWILAPIRFSGSGYNLFYSSDALYTFPNGNTVTVGYYYAAPFSVYCGVELCQLLCALQKFYDVNNTKCGNVQNLDAQANMVKASYLMAMINSAIIQPLCGFDVVSLINKVKKLINADNCGCSELMGINVSPLPTTPCCPPISALMPPSSSCTAPTSATSAAYTGTAVQASWNNVSGVHQYEVLLTGSSTTPTSIVGNAVPSFVGTITTASIPVTVSGTYYFWVRSICAASGTFSAWVNLGSVTF